MKIYTRIVMDLDTLDVLESEHHEYQGPLALCWSASNPSGDDNDGGPNDGAPGGSVGMGHDGISAGDTSSSPSNVDGGGMGIGGMGDGGNGDGSGDLISDPAQRRPAQPTQPESTPHSNHNDMAVMTQKFSYPVAEAYTKAKQDWEVFKQGFRQRLQETSTALREHGSPAMDAARRRIRSGLRTPERDAEYLQRRPDVYQTMWDEGQYLSNNRDVWEAVQRGEYGSGREHFLEAGKGEGRGFDDPAYLERNPDVRQAVEDHGTYLERNPDVAAAVEAGHFSHGGEHFEQHGRAEGRHFDEAAYLESNPDVLNSLRHESTYLEQNPDVAEAVKAGQFKSGADHFGLHGFEEGRHFNEAGYLESNPDVLNSLRDEAEYLARNPDVAEAVKAGHFKSGADHFEQHGFEEGRHFDEAAYLESNPDVLEGLRRGEFASGWDHYNRVGRHEGRDVRKFMQPGWFTSGWEHYNEVGRHEGREAEKSVQPGWHGSGWEHYQGAGQAEGRPGDFHHGEHMAPSGFHHYANYGLGENRHGPWQPGHGDYMGTPLDHYYDQGRYDGTPYIGFGLRL